jgi:hypothetical protein
VDADEEDCDGVRGHRKGFDREFDEKGWATKRGDSVIEYT